MTLFQFDGKRLPPQYDLMLFFKEPIRGAFVLLAAFFWISSMDLVILFGITMPILIATPFRRAENDRIAWWIGYDRAWFEEPAVQLVYLPWASVVLTTYKLVQAWTLKLDVFGLHKNCNLNTKEENEWTLGQILAIVMLIGSRSPSSGSLAR
jgi:hypothetical protein